MGVPDLRRRLEGVTNHRRESTEASTQEKADVPNQFYYLAYRPTDAIIVPATSSERREYIPIGYVGPETLVSNAAYAAYGAEPWLFALLTSRMHMAWMRSVGGKLKTDYRYAPTLVYNHFPVPPLSQSDKAQLAEAAFRVLDVREYHSEKTLEELYDPDKMPANLRLAHQQVDDLVDSIYRERPFTSDEERLSHLFDRYVEMTEEEAKK